MSLPDLNDRTAVITGASRGIGAALAKDFADRGMRLGLVSRSEPALQSSSAVVSECVDVTDAAALERFGSQVEDRFGKIDLWINNAGLLEPISPIRDVAVEDFRRHIDVNLTGVFIGTQLYVRHLRARGEGGVLINISSGAAWKAYEGWGAYCAGKSGVERLTECVALEESESGLRAYSVAPGIVDTDMQALIRTCTPDRFPMVERFHEAKRDGTFNSPEFVARHLLALAFDPEVSGGDDEHEVAVRLPDEER